MKRCKHLRIENQWRAIRLISSRCIDCHEQLPLGPANVGPDAAIELRAAEIAADGVDYAWPHPVLRYPQNIDVINGWLVHQTDSLRGHLTGSEQAGYMARVIATHGEDS